MNVRQHDQLQNIELDLMKDKEKEILSIISTINYSDIDSVEKFQKVTELALSKLRLKKVTLGNPKIISHRVKEKEIPRNALNPFGGKWKGIEVDVEIPIEGSQELLEYHPNGYHFGNEYSGIFQPEYGSCLSINVESTTFEKHEILQKVEQLMTMTKQFIYANNNRVDHFNDLIISRFNTELSRHRDNLAKLYA